MSLSAEEKQNIQNRTLVENYKGVKENVLEEENVSPKLEKSAEEIKEFFEGEFDVVEEYPDEYYQTYIENFVPNTNKKLFYRL